MGYIDTKERKMQYQVTYRLIHSEYLPTTFTQLIHAHTHYDLIEALATLKQKWEARGYNIRILRIREHASRNS